MKYLSACALICLLLTGTLSALAAAEGLPEAAREEYRIPASLGTLYGELRLPAGKRPVPLVILCHGFGGNHTGVRDYAEHFVSGGYAAFSLDFCGGGYWSLSSGTMREMSVLTEAEDLNAVIDFFLNDPRILGISLFGESQGGFVASFVAAQRPEDIKALLLEYPAYVLEDDAKRRQLPDGSYPEQSLLLGMVISRRYSEDAANSDIYGRIAGYFGPVLIVHGDRDSLVPLRYSERAAEVFPDARLIVLPGQGHGFRGTARTEAMEKELAFLNEHHK